MSTARLQQIMQTAQPMGKVLSHKPSLLSRTRIPTAGTTKEEPTVVQGHRGDDSVPDENEVDDLPQDNEGGIGPQNYGTGNQNTVYHYSDYLVSTKLMKQYPYRATGFFLFKQGGSFYYCTGALISPSILLVAGHCVHSGNNSDSGWDTEGYYYPAATDYNGGPNPKAPYGYATAAQFYTWTSWYSTGALDQGYDVGLVVLNQRIGRKGADGEVGSKTGWLGFCTSACLQTYWFFSQLGYPGNYYGGNRLTEGQHLYASDSRDYIWGSGMSHGSSGGPHIANIGELSDSASNQGLWPYRNVAFLPTSWGYDDPQYKIQGGSALTGPNNTFDFAHNLYNLACTTSRALHGAGSCSLF
jgi:V8-like Glu-specific endopeptidase